MSLITKAPRGTQDVLPSQSYKNRFLESTLLEIADEFGFKEIRTPVFEHTELFTRSVGDTTDVVQKEMYTFKDKGERSITLRPEGTAGAARAFLEHGLYNEPLPQKVCYLTSCYRYEKPQAGRLREFHQFGVECFGTASPAADAEVISLANEIFGFFGVEDIHLEINSIGCPECRKKYHAALKEYFESKKESLCPTCLERLDKNPMRILDCKSPICSEIAAKAPIVLDYLCDDCADHFKKVQQYLDEMLIPYSINPQIVRGLDYYTRTVFEFVSDSIGAQGTVCGGGRYNGLVQEIGGPDLPGVGFGMGVARLVRVMDLLGIEIPRPNVTDVFVCTMGDNARLAGIKLVNQLRRADVKADMDHNKRSLKAQFKFADKCGARYVIVLGEDDLAQGVAKLRNMQTHEESDISLSDIDTIQKILNA